MSELIFQVQRGEEREIGRIRLIEGSAWSLERFENGTFEHVRTFQCEDEVIEGGTGDASPDDATTRAVRYISRFMDGTVNVGERDLLSPTSAFSRSVRWLPGDIQMLRTAGHYVAELFPSAQFHVTQLLRRVFGDVAFLALIGVTSGLMLRARSPVALSRLATVLQLLSLAAIVGLDRYWEPLRYRLARHREIASIRDDWGHILLGPLLVVWQLLAGTMSMVLTTVLGLANLALNPIGIWQAIRRIGGARSLSWMASSVSVGGDIRGRPLEEFAAVYRPATRLGIGAALFAAWLVLLGAPANLLGVTGIGVFVACFSTAFVFAWFSALPHVAGDGRPLYTLSRADFLALSLWGATGLGAIAVSWRLGIAPIPAFEGSVGFVVLFVTCTALFALAYPTYYTAKRAIWAWAARYRVIVFLLPPTAAIAIACGCGMGRPSLLKVVERVDAFLGLDVSRWRMPEAERQVYADIGAAMRRHASADPEPLLSDQVEQPALKARPALSPPDLQDLHGIPSPKLRMPTLAPEVDLPELYPLPIGRRLFAAKPQRRFLLAASDTWVRRPASAVVGEKGVVLARRLAAAVTPRVLSSQEVLAVTDFISRADYPWITQEDLRALGAPNEKGERVDVAELARVYRWDTVKANWYSVEAAQRGGVDSRVRLARLTDAIDGTVGLGEDPTPETLQRYLDEELGLVEGWSHHYPHLPFASTQASLLARGRFSQVARFLLREKMSSASLAQHWRLDYVDAYWHSEIAGALVYRVFRDRVRSEPWEMVDLDWEDNEHLRQRWDELQTQQSVGSRIWRAAGRAGEPSPAELREIVILLDNVLSHIVDGSNEGPYALLANLFRLEGVDPQRLHAGDSVAALLASRLWAQSMAGRVGKIVSSTVAGIDLPGNDESRNVLRDVAKTRFPDDGGDPKVRRLLDWLVVADATETYREIAAGYDTFVREAQDRGITLQGLSRAPSLSDARITSDLVELWSTLPTRYPNIPVRADMVAEFLAQTAYLSTRDGIAARTTREFVDDFADVFRAVDGLSAEPPPRALQDWNDALLVKMQGRTSRSASGRQFLAWWTIALQAKILDANFAHHGISRRADIRDVGARWAEIVTSGTERWPHLPWGAPGFSEFFLQIQSVEGWNLQTLWARFADELTDSDRLVARHIVPYRTFESIVDRRIARTGSPGFDPVMRQVNAIFALAKLLRVVGAQGIHRFDGNPALLTEEFSLLYEEAARRYPALYWDTDGVIEFYLLLQLEQGWGREILIEKFRPEWALAQSFAANGVLSKFEVIAAADEATLAPDDRKLRAFVDMQSLRIEQKTGVRSKSNRARAMNALFALSSLVLSAGEEGQIPEQQGIPWSKEKTRNWAGAVLPDRISGKTKSWALALAGEWGALLRAMEDEGPHFPWHSGAVIETNLLAMRNAGATLGEMRTGFAPIWKAASDLFQSNLRVPPPFQALVVEDAMSDLRRKIARVRRIEAARIPDADVRSDDSALDRLDAILVLADMVAEIRVKYGEDPDPTWIADRVVEARELGPQKYSFIPWAERGLVPSLVTASYQSEFKGDFWKYVNFINWRDVDSLLADGGLQAADGANSMPAEVINDVRTMMRDQSGRAPGSDEVVVVQALQDGVLLIKQFVPKLSITRRHVIAVVHIRARIRGLSRDLQPLHIVTTSGHAVRVGFADRLAAIAVKQGIQAGLDPSTASFVDDAVNLVKGSYLSTMSDIDGLVRDSLCSDEIEYFKESIRLGASADNTRRAAKYGLRSDSLSSPDVLDDDVVADMALYEILYAKEIGKGRDYLVHLFTIYDRIRRRPEFERQRREGLDRIDRVFASRRKNVGDPEYETWRRDPLYPEWLERRGVLLKKSRGRLIAMSRAFALLEEAAFSSGAETRARSSFARFGSFERYVDAFFDDFDRINSIPALSTALDRVDHEDAFLGDGVRFAFSLFELHVVDRIYPDHAEAIRTVEGIASFLPAVAGDYAAILGFVPRFESGVPLYDARVSWLRSRLERGPGTDLWRRLNIVQRGVQGWSERYVLKQAYSVLFHRDLDEEDPTPSESGATSGGNLVARIAALLPGARGRTRGDEVAEFLTTRLPLALEGRTGTRDISAWIEWLIENGEVGLDGATTGRNPYAEESASLKSRTEHYEKLVEDGTRLGRNVRAETQRIRDIGEEATSRKRQVDWLKQAAEQSKGAAVARQADYECAISRSGLILAVFLAGLSAIRVLSVPGGALRRFGPPSLGLAAVIAGLAAPVIVAVNPPWASACDPVWARLGLIDAGHGGERRPRGAAAQLAKSRPWSLFANAPRGLEVAP